MHVVCVSRVINQLAAKDRFSIERHYCCQCGKGVWALPIFRGVWQNIEAFWNAKFEVPLEFEPLGESILQDDEGEAVARLCV